MKTEYSSAPLLSTPMGVDYKVIGFDMEEAGPRSAIGRAPDS